MPTKVNDAIEITVIVAEEDYKFSLWDSDLTKQDLAEIMRDAHGDAEFIYIQTWLLKKGENENTCLQAGLNEQVGRTWRVVG